MNCRMRKPRELKFSICAERMTEINKYLDILTGSSVSDTNSLQEYSIFPLFLKGFGLRKKSSLFPSIFLSTNTGCSIPFKGFKNMSMSPDGRRTKHNKR